MHKAFDLAGRTALITGASSGIGARFAKTLAAAGANVVAAARRKERLDALVAEIGAQGGRAIAVSMDVADEASVVAGFDAAEAAFGNVAAIVANAGVALEDARATEINIADFDALMNVNVRGVFLSAREGAKRLMAAGSREKEHGRVVIVSSITANKVFRGLAPYAASKAAVLQMGRCLAMDWARQGICVNMILPGYITTELTGDMFSGDAGKQLLASFPRRRLVDESDMDGIIQFLCSDASKAVTGASFVVDDGQSL